MENVKPAVKTLDSNKHKELFDYVMDLGPFDNLDLTEEFVLKLKPFIINMRESEEAFKIKTLTMVNTLRLLGYTEEQQLMFYIKDIGLLVADANKVFKNVLLFGKVRDINGRAYREEAIFKKPEDLRVSPQRTYSRIRFLESEEGMRQRRKKGPVTRKNAIVQSESEFQKQFHINNNELAKKYPFDIHAIDKVISWEENKDFIVGLRKRGFKYKC